MSEDPEEEQKRGFETEQITEEELKKASKGELEEMQEMKQVRERVITAAEREGKKEAKIIRVPTGIPGFDELIEGGFEKNSTVLIIGGAGTGKTTFVMQYIYNGVTKYGQPGVFLSFEEQKEKLYKHMRLFGWDFEELEKQGMFTYLSYEPYQVEDIMSKGGGTIRDAMEDLEKKGGETLRFGMDSLTSFTTMFHDEYQARENTIKLFEKLAEWNCTSLITVEPHYMSPESPHTDIGVEFMVDGVIALYQIKSGDVRETALEVLKMRATNHVRKICPYKFQPYGIEVYPHETVFGAKLF